MKKIYVYDLETYPNFFLASFLCIKTGKYYEFEISDRKSQIRQLYRFLHQKGLSLIGFNNLNFDYPVLHNTLLNKKKNWTSQEIYEEVKKVIDAEYSAIWDNQIKIPQLDLFKIWHYDNKNKRTSLKWLEFAMRMENVEDLPFKVGTNLTNKQKDITISYCRNDLDATYEFFKKSEKHIKIRQFYTKLEGINLINASETKIAKDVFGKYLSKDINISYNELRKMRTERNYIPIKDIIFPYIKFKHKQNNEVLNYFNNTIWKKDEEGNSTKLEYSIDYLNVKREYGEGGLHSFGKPGVFESNEDYMVYDLDFASFYPHISFKHNLHPEHIPEKIFSEKYEGFYIERKKYPKSDPRNYVLKIILNSSYGLSKDKYAYLYDPKWQLAITINGQLLLSMLTEWVVESTSYCKILFENTDGAAYVIKRSEKHLVDKVCKRMEELCGIGLEAQECQKLIMRDVNNYINIISNDNIKFKGAFEIDRDYHKNHSKRIVPIALAEYFINNNNIENTIYNHLSKIGRNHYTNHLNNFICKNYGIYDFCLGAKMKGNNRLVSREILNNSIVDIPLSKMTRYYISNDGVQLIKILPPLPKDNLSIEERHSKDYGNNQLTMFGLDEIYSDEVPERESNLESSYLCTIFNKYEEKLDYNINYNYYINECNKIINQIEQ